jgi:hypothetical protein
LSNNAELVDIIVDGGESTKSLNRPGMARLLAHWLRRSAGGYHREAHLEREGFLHPAWGASSGAAQSVGESSGRVQYYVLFTTPTIFVG